MLSSCRNCESKKKINTIFGVPVQHFCAPFDSLRSTGKQQMKLIKANYEFFHSTFPGSNSENPDPYFIRRVNVESFWPLGAVKFACSGMEWKRWQKQREEFHQIIKNQ